MAITINNNTIREKYSDGDGNLFAAILATDEILNAETPATLDQFWPEVGPGENAFLDGKIKTVSQSTLCLQKEQGDYILFGLRNYFGNRKKQLGFPEFVAFYNFLLDKGQILTREQFNSLEDVSWDKL